MGYNLFWKPFKDKGKEINTMAAGSVISALHKAFGNGRNLRGHEWVLDKNCLDVLYGMSSVNTGNIDPYKDIIDAINKSGSIKIWAE